MLTIILSVLLGLFNTVISGMTKAMEKFAAGLYAQYTGDAYVWYTVRCRYPKAKQTHKYYNKVLKDCKKQYERALRASLDELATRCLGKYQGDAKSVRKLIRTFQPKYWVLPIPNDLFVAGFEALNYLRDEGNASYRNTRDASQGCVAVLMVMGLIGVNETVAMDKKGRYVIDAKALSHIMDTDLRNRLHAVLCGDNRMGAYNKMSNPQKVAMWERMLKTLRGYVRYVENKETVTKDSVNIISTTETPFFTWEKDEEGKWTRVPMMTEVNGVKYHCVSLGRNKENVVVRSSVDDYKDKHKGYAPEFIQDASASSVMARVVFAMGEGNTIITIKPQRKGDDEARLMSELLDYGFVDKDSGTMYRFLAMPAGKMKTCQFVFTSIPQEWANNPCAYIGYVWGKAMGLTAYADKFVAYNGTDHIVTMDEVVALLSNKEFMGYKLVNEKGLANIAKAWSRFGLSMSSTFSLRDLAEGHEEFTPVFEVIKNMSELRVRDASTVATTAFYTIGGLFDIHKPLTEEQAIKRACKRFDGLTALLGKVQDSVVTGLTVSKNISLAKKSFTEKDNAKAVEILGKVKLAVESCIAIYSETLEEVESGSMTAQERKACKTKLGYATMLAEKADELALDIKNGVIASETRKTLTPGDGEMLANIKVIGAIATLLRKITVDEYSTILDWWNNSDKILANVAEDDEIRAIVAKMPIAFTIRLGGKKGLLKLADWGQMLDAKTKDGKSIVEEFDIITPDSAEKFSTANWNDAEFGVCLVGKVHSDKDVINTNAFMLSALKLTPKQIISVAKEIIDEMVEALSDADKAVAFFAKYDEEFDCQNGPMTLLAMNKKLLKMDVVQLAIRSMTKRVLTNMACGRIKVPGNTAFIACDWAELLNLWLADEFTAAGVHVKTLDEYAKEKGVEGYKAHYSNKDCDAMLARSPGYGWQEIVRVTLMHIDAWWWNHDVCELSVADGIWENLQGADFDGDKASIIFSDNRIGKMFVDAVRHGSKLINRMGLGGLLPVYLAEPGVIIEQKQKKAFTWKAIRAMLVGTLGGDQVGILSKAAMAAIDIANELIILAEIAKLTGYKVWFYDKFSKGYAPALGQQGKPMFVSDRFNHEQSVGNAVPCDKDGTPLDPRLVVNGMSIKNELTDDERILLGDLFDVNGDERLYTGWVICTLKNGERVICVEAPSIGRKTKKGTTTVTVNGKEKTETVYEYTRYNWTLSRDVSSRCSSEEEAIYQQMKIEGLTSLEHNEVFVGYKTVDQLEEAATEFAKLGIINGCECGREIDRTKNGFGHLWGLLISIVPAHRIFSDWARKGQCNETLVRNQHISTSVLGVLYQYVQAREKEIDALTNNGVKMIPYVANLLTEEEYNGVWTIIKNFVGERKGYKITGLESIRNSYLNEIRGVDINEEPEKIQFAQAMACKRVVMMCDELHVPYTSAAVAAFFMGTKDGIASSFAWLLADDFAEVIKRDPDSRRIVNLNQKKVLEVEVDKDGWLVATIPAYKVNRKTGFKAEKGTKKVYIERLEGVAAGKLSDENIFMMGHSNFVAIPWSNNTDATLVTERTAPRFNIVGNGKTNEELIAIANHLCGDADGVPTKIIVDEDGKLVGIMMFADGTSAVFDVDTYKVPIESGYKQIVEGLELATLIGKTFRSYGVKKGSGTVEAYAGEKLCTSISTSGKIVNVFVR